MSLVENYKNIIKILTIPQILVLQRKQWIGLFQKNAINQWVIEYMDLHLYFQK